ncbi:MAG: hypothetical protein LBI92_12150 [Azoarcus sp.]|jgi:O-antigen ligase|nr:hypothetical protein [Azoarcus sp.]
MSATLTSPFGAQALRRYMAFALLAFMAGFILSPSLRLVANLCIVFLLLPGAFALVRGDARLPRCTPASLCWGLLFFWCLIQGAWFSAAPGGGQYAKHLALAFLFMLCASALCDPAYFRSERFARSAFWLLTAYVLLAALMQWLTGGYQPPRTMHITLFWTIAATNYFTGALLVAFFALAMPCWLKAGDWRHFTLALVLILFILSFIFQQRSALVALALVLAVGVIIAFRLSACCGKRLVLILAIFVALAVLLWLFVPGTHSLETRGSSGRTELWRKHLLEWQRCGLWSGCGPRFQSALIFRDRPLMHPHNLFLSFAVLNGGVGLACLLLAIGTTLIQALRNRDPWGLVFLAGLTVMAFSGGYFLMRTTPSWVLLLLPAALILNPQPRCSARPEH